MLVHILKLIFRRTLNSVVFGISLMVLVAMYIAIGSGRPDIRAFFEMSDLQFFNAWPLQALMVLLVLNLATVTWTRIPFTPPRYGVWTIHAGIIVLIGGMAAYYSQKVEGTTRIPVGQTVDHFYDGAERSLYVKVDGRLANSYGLPSLPRYNAYDASLDNANYLNQSDLRGILPTMLVQPRDGAGGPQEKSLKDAFGWPHELTIDIVGYYPYANIVSRFVEDPASDTVGVKVELTDPHTNREIVEWIVASEPTRRLSKLENAELEHRHVDSTILRGLTDAAGKILKVEAKLASRGSSETLFVEPAKPVALGDTGYTITAEQFVPQWPTIGGKVVPALTLNVKSPTQEFRRMVLGGDPLQTDFKLGAEAAGPMGARQKEPLDKDLTLLFTLNDLYGLMPRQGATKHTLVTTVDAGALTEIVTGTGRASAIRTFETGTGVIDVDTEAGGGGGPFMQAMRARQGGGHEGHDHGPAKVTVTRSANLRFAESVEVVPPVKRDRNMGDLGVFQVAKARLRMGDWSREVLVPYAQDVVENRWDGTPVKIPGTDASIHLQLGQTRLQLPAKITLNRFDLIPYPGGEPRQGSMFRDFKSTLTIEDPRTGERFTATAHMNNPVYFDVPGPVPVLGKLSPFTRSWLFFQAAYDPERQAWTILGVGNRPAVWVMTAGCVMIFGGLLYAFYVKPILIRRMKEQALANAAASGKLPGGKKKPVAAEPVLVSSTT